MSITDIEAKSLSIHKIEDLIIDPIFTIFHLQHNQVASRTDTDNERLLHFKNSMLSIRKWNSDVVKNFYSSLFLRFPLLTDFENIFKDLQDVICKILTQSSSTTKHVREEEDVFNILHRIIYECSDAFISTPEWFSVEEDSPHYQVCKNNAKAKMKEQKIIENVAMSFTKTMDATITVSDSRSPIEPSDDEVSDQSSSQEESEHELENEDLNGYTKKINIETGEVDTVSHMSNDEVEIPPSMSGKFSTFVKENVVEKKEESSDDESEISSEYSSRKESSDESSSSSNEESSSSDESVRFVKKKSNKKKKKYRDESSSSDSSSDSSDSDFEIPMSVLKKLMKISKKKKEIKDSKKKSKKDRKHKKEHSGRR